MIHATLCVVHPRNPTRERGIQTGFPCGVPRSRVGLGFSIADLVEVVQFGHSGPVAL